MGLLVLHAVVLLAVGSNHPDWFFGLGPNTVGSILSDCLQLVFGGLLISVSAYTARKTEGWYSRFWKLHAFAFILWSSAQAITVLFELYPAAATTGSSLQLTQNVLFCFWFIPLGLALFIDPTDRTQGFDWLLSLDFSQGVLACIAAYLYFFYLPRLQSPTDLSDAVWAPYFAGYLLIIAVFVVRGRLSASPQLRCLFSRVALVLGASCSADALYYYGHIRNSVGAWFDLLWSFLLFSHLLLPRDLSPDPYPESTMMTTAQVETPPHRFVALQLSPLLLAICTLAMSAQIAREKFGVACILVVICFVLFGVRHLVTHYRLLGVQEALRREAMHDGLTGMWRHNAILEILDRELLRAQRTNEPVSVIMADLDHFKLVNDRLGHAAGDDVLRRVARELDDAVRPYDSVGRYGGEEFLIVAPACATDAASALAERIRTRIAGLNISFNGVTQPVTISLGVVAQVSSDSEELLLLADRALYQAKARGRNRVEMATGESSRNPIPERNKES